MDIPFDVTKWQPTKPLEEEDSELTDDDLTSLSQKLADQTKQILLHPYDADGWFRRASTLTRLRYPELALGDAHKAIVLCQSHLARLQDQNWHLGARMGFWMHDPGYQNDESREMLQEYLAKLQSRAHRVEIDNMHFFPAFEEGRLQRRPYPWTSDRHQRRDDELLLMINQEFASNAAKMWKDGPLCEVRRHAFGVGVDGQDTSDLLGVFASCDIRKGDIVLVDRTRTWGCIGPGTERNLANLQIAGGCGNAVHPNDEYDDSTQDLRWVRDQAEKYTASVLLGCRLLLCSIQDGSAHPLDHPLIARLTPTYRRDSFSTFSLLHDIVIPNEALRQFGIDIFTNHNYDTWVLFTIQARAHNNSSGDPVSDSLSPLFSLFNHSCEPNVKWTTSTDHRTIRVKAWRQIKQGEQLFVIYDGYMRNEPLAARRKKLQRWLDGPCQCTRCTREEEQQQQQQQSSAVEGEAVWDVEEKPVFPEDCLKLKN